MSGPSSPGAPGLESWTPVQYMLDLEAFLEVHASDLFSGTTTLQLHPRGLEHVSTRLATLDGLKHLKHRQSELPLEYIRAYVSDIDDYQRLERVQVTLARVMKLKLASLHKHARDPTPVQLNPFRQLQSLEMHNCDLSTHPVAGLVELRPHLCNLVVANSTETLRNVLDPPLPSLDGDENQMDDQATAREGAGARSDDPSTSSSGAVATGGLRHCKVWQKLATFNCAHNSCTRMDGSITLLPCVTSLNLSHNSFAVVRNLHSCINLTALDLSFNRISSVVQLNERCGNLTELRLACNSLSSTEGLDKLYSLEVLDLSGNLISDIKEVVRVAALPCLEVIWLRENPLFYSSRYRTQVLACFANPEAIKLDNEQTGEKELNVICRNRRDESLLSSFGALATTDLRPKDSGTTGCSGVATSAKGDENIVSTSAQIKPRMKSPRIVDLGKKDTDDGTGGKKASIFRTLSGQASKTTAGNNTRRTKRAGRDSWMWSDDKKTGRNAKVDVPYLLEEDSKPLSGRELHSGDSPPRFNENVIERLRHSWLHHRSKPTLLLEDNPVDSPSSSPSSSFGVYSDSDEEEYIQNRMFSEWEQLEQVSVARATEILDTLTEESHKYQYHCSCYAVVPKRNWSVEFCCLVIVSSSYLHIFQATSGQANIRGEDLVMKAEICGTTYVKVGLGMQIMKITSQSFKHEACILVTGASSWTSSILSQCSPCNISTWELEEMQYLSDVVGVEGHADLRAYAVLIQCNGERSAPYCLAVIGEKLVFSQVHFMGFGDVVDSFYEGVFEHSIADICDIGLLQDQGGPPALFIKWEDETEAKFDSNKPNTLMLRNYRTDFRHKIAPVLKTVFEQAGNLNLLTKLDTVLNTKGGSKG